MKEVGSLGEIHGSQFSYSLLCKSLKFYTKPWFFLVAIYAIAITTYSYVINMCVFAHALSRGGVPGHRSSGSDFNPCSSHGEDQQGSEVHQLIHLCSYTWVWTHLDFLGLWNGSCWLNTSPPHWDSQQQALYDPLRSLSRSQPLFCAQMLTLSVEPAKWDLREKPRMWLNTFPPGILSSTKPRRRYSCFKCKIN